MHAREQKQGVTLLTLDYPGRRVGRRIAEMGLTQHGFELHELLKHPLPRATTGREYAACLMASDNGVSPDTAAILAYCGAAPLAQELAWQLVEHGHRPPPLVIFDSAPFGADKVAECYRSSVRQIAGPDFEPTVDVASLLHQPGPLLEQIGDELFQLAQDILRREGFTDSEIAEQVHVSVGLHLDYLAHAIAIHRSESPDWGGDVLHIISRDHSFTAPWPGARRTTTRRISCSTEALLSEADARAEVLSFLRDQSG